MTNEVIKKLDLSNGEWQALEHRLTAPDALADALDEYHEQDVVEVADLLARGDLRGSLEISVGITHAVLSDCVEGSTWYGALIANASDQAQSGSLRVLNSLARKVGKYVGRKLRVPEY